MSYHPDIPSRFDPARPEYTAAYVVREAAYPPHEMSRLDRVSDVCEALAGLRAEYGRLAMLSDDGRRRVIAAQEHLRELADEAIRSLYASEDSADEYAFHALTLLSNGIWEPPAWDTAEEAQA